ncbi:hypothetical protein ACIGB8_28285 [Promicromonospora sukumoe]|uniref:hypothetical protein n=1 Tax=Promicromonospora sukumoe TaxID=88382 RepID=UPI0037C8BB18
MTSTTNSTPALSAPCFARVTERSFTLREGSGSAVMVSPSFHPRDNLDLVGDHRAPSRRRVEGGKPPSMRTTRPVLTAALLLALAAGCTAGTGPDSPTPNPSAVSPSPSVSTSPSPTPTDAETLARMDAEELVHEYYAVIDQLGADQDVPLSRLKNVTASVELQVRQADLEQWRKDGWRKTGTTQISDLTVQSVTLENSDPAAGLVPTVQIDVCYDVSAVDILDAEDTSVVSPDRADRAWERLQVANYTYEDDPSGGWRVAALESLEKAPCAAS